MPAPIVYMIRHGEKPPKQADGSDADGLSAQGIERAQYLPQVFGPASSYNIQYILAEKPKKDGSRSRPYDTVKPLAEELGLEIHTRDRDDVHGAAKAVKGYDGHGNVLVCWEHGELAKIAAELGVDKFAKDSGWAGREVKYPGERFDLVWVVPHPYGEIAEVRSERCPGLDNGLEPVP